MIKAQKKIKILKPNEKKEETKADNSIGPWQNTSPSHINPFTDVNGNSSKQKNGMN